MVDYLPRVVFGTVAIFHNIASQAALEAGRIQFPLSELTGVSLANVANFLQPFLNLFVTPNWVPPFGNFPVLSSVGIELQNPKLGDSWIYTDGNSSFPEPDDDPFYSPDVGDYQNLNNGEIVDIREVGLSFLWVNVAKAYQISFKSSNTFGHATKDVTTVMIPNNPNGKVVSYQNWEDACALKCSPSYSILTGIADPTLDILLLLGYVVNWPDHEGYYSAFAAGVKEGYSTLDSIRAFLNAREQIGLSDGYDKIVMWGYSGGSIATGHATESLPGYAPELNQNIVGAIMGGFVTNITQVISSINGGIFAGFGFAGIYGLGQEYPEIKEVIDGAFRTGYKNRFNEVGKACIFDNIVNFLLQNVWGYTDDVSGEKYLSDPRVYKSLENEWLGVHNTPDLSIPLVVYQGAQDEIILATEVDRTVDAWCAAGVRVDYYRLALLEHISTEVLAVVDALKWVAMFFDGYVPAPCKDHEEATLATSFYYDAGTDNWDALVHGDWDAAGVVDAVNSEVEKWKATRRR